MKRKGGQKDGDPSGHSGARAEVAVGDAVRRQCRLRLEIALRSWNDGRQGFAAFWLDRVGEEVGDTADASAGETAKSEGTSTTVSREFGH